MSKINDASLWCVWSNEHGGGWWAEGGGYTGDPAKAKRMAFEEARQICASADYRCNSHNAGTHVPPETMMPAVGVAHMLRQIESMRLREAEAARIARVELLESEAAQ